MNALWVLASAAVASFAMTWLVRVWADRLGMVDVPNARSSHTAPTPRGGGVAIAVTFLLSLVLLCGLGLVETRLCVALSGAGAWVASLGFADDRKPMSARVRLAGHAGAAVWVLFWLGDLPPLTLGTLAPWPAWLATTLAFLYLIWLLNLYNFMDGIDGIASIEAITVCGGAVLLSLLLGSGGPPWIPPALLLACVAGFLFWNYPPASVFMGDTGSGLIGMTLGILSLSAAWSGLQVFWAWIILLGVFIADATTTLLRRLVRGARIYEAHRSHAYQYASRRFGGHRVVSLAVGALNLIWLLPIALLVGSGRLTPAVGLLVAYVPLVWVAFVFKAGAAESQQ